MPRVITFSLRFPSYHPKKGEPTYFVEKFLRSIYYGKTPLLLDHLEKLNPDYTNISDFRADLRHPMDFEPKHHTIRAGKRWKAGDYCSPRVWGNDINPKSGRSGAYHSKQIILAPDTLITNVYDFEIKNGAIFIDGKEYDGETERSFEVIDELAKNDGLDRHDLLEWFKYPKPFSGQIIAWNNCIKY